MLTMKMYADRKGMKEAVVRFIEDYSYNIVENEKVYHLLLDEFSEEIEDIDFDMNGGDDYDD